MSLKHHKLAVITEDYSNLNHSIPFELAALQTLTEEPEISVQEEDINVVPDSAYKEILRKYPELLKQTFSEETEGRKKHFQRYDRENQQGKQSFEGGDRENETAQ